MSNRAQRRRAEKAGHLEKSPKPVNKQPSPTINVFTKEGMFHQQVSLGPAYVAEFTLPLDLAENFVKECQEVLMQMRTGFQVEKTSSQLIVP